MHVMHKIVIDFIVDEPKTKMYFQRICIRRIFVFGLCGSLKKKSSKCNIVEKQYLKQNITKECLVVWVWSAAAVAVI